MTFFYNLNKKLDEIRATPELKHGQLNERDMSRAAKGYEKYGKEGMEALAKAGREGKALDPVRAKYDKYDESMEEGLGSVAKKIGGAVKKVAGRAMDALHGSDEDMIRDLQRKAGMPQTGLKPGAEPNPKQIKEKMSPAKAKSFAALAEPRDKITFADKIAGAKKEVDEMLGDVAAEAMKKAIGGHSEEMDEAGYSAKAARAGKDIGKPGKNFAKIAKGAAERYGSKERGEKVAGAVLAKLRKPGHEEMEEGWDDMLKDVERRRSATKKGEITHGAKHDIENTGTGRRVTRRTDPNTGYSVGADDDKPADGEKRGRGRPKGTKAAVGAKGPSGKSKLMTKESDNESDDIKQAMAMLKKAGYKVSKAADGAEQVDEKAVSKKQQRFMGMVHATQKGEKAPSKEVAKVAKSMGKKDAEDFASTKHKGLPEKKKSEGKKKEVEETSDNKSSGGMSFGKGIYDSLNRDLEDMIAESMARLDESMSINMSMNNDDMSGGARQTLTVTATDEDAMKLGQLLKMAGLGGEQGGGCGCGSSPCSCGSNAEVVDENQPDWPTNTETSDDALQYSGGLNKPKSTGQTTIPVIASQDERQYADVEEDAIKRMMEMAGIQEAKGKKPDFLDVDKDGDKKEPFKKAVDDKKEKQVDEGILSATANLWKAYKG